MDTTQDWLKRGSSGWSSKGGSGGHGASNGPTVGLAQATCLWRSASPCEGPRLPRQPGPRRRIAGLTSWCLLSFTNHQMVPTALDVMTRSDGDVREETRPALAGGSMTCCGRFGKWGAGSVIHAASPKPRAEAMAATHSAHGSGSELGSAGRFSLCVSNAVHPVPRVGFSPRGSAAWATAQSAGDGAAVASSPHRSLHMVASYVVARRGLNCGHQKYT